MTLDPNTPVLRCTSATILDARDIPGILAKSSIVEGNRYDGYLSPDPQGAYVALVTHRGPDAPPRPETLPVGTRVRRGPDWTWWNQDGTPGNLGTVRPERDHPQWARVEWDGAPGSNLNYSWGDGGLYDLEVVSLPEAAAEPKPLVPAVSLFPVATATVTGGVDYAVVWVHDTPAVIDVKRDGNVIHATVTHKPDFVCLDITFKPAPPRAVGTYGPNPHEGTASNLPSEDYTPAHVLARRKPVVSTPTDLDDHFLVDAEPTGIVPRK